MTQYELAAIRSLWNPITTADTCAQASVTINLLLDEVGKLHGLLDSKDAELTILRITRSVVDANGH